MVPTSMRQDMMKLIHASHLGIEKCKRRARDVLFWPAQIEDLVSSCSACSTYQRSNTKEPLMPQPAPSLPWEKVGDNLICELNGRNFLILVDYYSNFIEIDCLRETTSEQIINACKAQFARHGIPYIVLSDNGPQFSSWKFKPGSISSLTTPAAPTIHSQMEKLKEQSKR